MLLFCLLSHQNRAHIPSSLCIKSNSHFWLSEDKAFEILEMDFFWLTSGVDLLRMCEYHHCLSVGVSLGFKQSDKLQCSGVIG